tara:strand:- start:594 stop:1217 length:624 start_codon:yes stop_codon:yes gene_type:complete
VVEIAPSMLGADFGEMRKAAELVAPESGYLHMDVMDGHFVPNLTMGSDLVKSLKGIGPLDVHLMITDPCDFIDNFVSAGAEIISIHVEANNPKEALKLIRKHNVKAGIALNPSTPEEAIDSIVDYADMILVMSVEPGYCGQSFHEGTIERVRNYKKKYPSKIIEVDGGVSTENSQQLIEAGADILVAGSAVFNSDNPLKIIRLMKQG